MKETIERIDMIIKRPQALRSELKAKSIGELSIPSSSALSKDSFGVSLRRRGRGILKLRINREKVRFIICLTQRSLKGSSIERCVSSGKCPQGHLGRKFRGVNRNASQ